MRWPVGAERDRGSHQSVEGRGVTNVLRHTMVRYKLRVNARNERSAGMKEHGKDPEARSISWSVFSVTTTPRLSATSYVLRRTVLRACFPSKRSVVVQCRRRVQRRNAGTRALPPLNKERFCTDCLHDLPGTENFAGILRGARKSQWHTGDIRAAAEMNATACAIVDSTIGIPAQTRSKPWCSRL